MLKEFSRIIGIEMKAQAAIVNYYPNPKCQMGAHVDDAELDMSKPIVSVSFGNTVGMLCT